MTGLEKSYEMMKTPFHMKASVNTYNRRICTKQKHTFCQQIFIKIIKSDIWEDLQQNLSLFYKFSLTKENLGITDVGGFIKAIF